MFARPARSIDRFPLPWIVLGWALAIAIPFRAAVFGGFDWLLGDRGDTLIEMAILEHWRNVFMRAEAWNALRYFDPHPGTLGYNDGYLLPGIFYAGLRSVLDPFRAQIVTAIILKSIGFAGAYLLVARTLGWGRGIALLVALLLSIANGMFVQSGHAQIQSLALLPWLAIFVTGAWRAEMAGARRRALANAIAGAAVLAMWLVTAFYFAWFSLYFSLVLLLSWAWLNRRLNLSGLKLLWRHRLLLGVSAAALLVFGIPFLAIYLPKVMETGGHHYMLTYLVYPTDTVNVGDGNLVWGWLVAGLRGAFGWVLGDAGADKMFGGEHRSGFPLILFALLCMSLWTLLRQRGDASFARAFAFAIVISWALVLRFGPVSPWIIVHALLPGASGVRVILRYQLFLILPTLLLVAYVWRARLAEARPLVALGLVALLIAEQINLAPVARLDGRAEMVALGAIPAPPADCKRFYVVASRKAEPIFINAQLNGLYPHNVDAMFLAERWRVPTINGFSTFNPPDWNFAEPLATDYDARVAAYARKHQLTGLCRLDMRDAQPWTQPGRAAQTLDE